MASASIPVRARAAAWLRQGISPRRLALTLALGFAIGCIPVLGVPTVLCVILALAFKLNLPAIQAANYLAMPLQLLLIAPFAELGERLFTAGTAHALTAGELLRLAPLPLAQHLGWLVAHALVAWLLVAIPAVAVMTLTFTPVLRKIPAVGGAEPAE